MYLIGIILIIVIFSIVIIYNSLIRKNNAVNNAHASIEAMLKKRHDLIPNLVTTVMTYLTYEKNLLTEITEMRAKAISGQFSNSEKSAIENQISKTMGNILVSAENYPDLKTNQNFLQLQAAWNEAEEQISAARRAFNASVMEYNNSVQSFPSNLMAGMMGYKIQNMFEIPETEKQSPDAKVLFKS